MFNLEKLNCAEFSLFSVEILLQSGRERRQVWTGTSLKQTSLGLFLEILIEGPLVPAGWSFELTPQFLALEMETSCVEALCTWGIGWVTISGLGETQWTNPVSFWKACAAWNLALALEKRLTRESVRSTKADFPGLAWWSSLKALIRLKLLEILLGEWYRPVETLRPAWRRWSSWKMCHCRTPFRLLQRGPLRIALPDETTWQVRFKMNFGDIYSVRKQYSSPKSWLKGRRMIYKVHPAGKLYRNIWSNRF